MKKKLKLVLGPIILAATLGGFIYYITHHPEVFRQLGAMPLATLGLLLLLYIVSFFVLVYLTRFSLRVYHKTMSRQENMLFNAYSSLINFFGPGQSGPIFRGAYLKKRHNLGIKQYVFVTLLYYGFFAVISAMLMLVGTRPWWQTALAMAVVAVGSLWFIRRYKRRAHIDTEGGLTPLAIGRILGITVLQVVLMAVIYGVELHAVGADPSVGQVLAYTGVANFALFVALTPGAIGIREGFLVFSQNLHHIDPSYIVTASVLDRGMYLVLLGLLFVLVIGLHAKDKLHITQLKMDTTGDPKKPGKA